MNTIILLMVLIVPAYLIQTYLGFKQMKKFGEEYKKLRKEGRVAIGRKSGAINSGVIVLLALDSNGFIIKGRKLQGTTVIADFKDYNILNGKYIGSISKDSEILENEFKNAKKAIQEAVDNYELVVNGKKIPEKEAPLIKIKNKVKNTFTKGETT